MAAFEFRLPDIGEGIAEGEVVAWHVAPGQLVHEDQEMVEVMTDKATVTIGSPRKGRIVQLNAKIGERVKVGSVLVVIDPSAAEASKGAGDAGSSKGGEPPKETRPSRFPPSADADTARSRFQAPAHVPPAVAGITRGAYGGRGQLRPVRATEEEQPGPSSQADARNAGAVSASAVGDIREDLPGASFFSGRAVPAARAAEPAPSTGAFFSAKPLATPATRKLARDLGIDLRRVSPTGAHGRVTKADVEGMVQAPRGAGLAARHERSAQDRRVPFVGLRRRIAERMRTAKDKA
ncbi:MAG TPA: biotin/lipoyl-containing protein, partial [Polyangiales bacterium]